MANIKTLPIYGKNEEEISISLFQKEEDLNLIGKEFFIQFLKIDEYDLYEKSYILKILIEKRDEKYFVKLKLKLMLPKGFYVISGYSNKIKDDIYRNSTFLPMDMAPIQIFENMDEVNLEKIEQFKTYAVNNYIEKKKRGWD